MSKGKIPVTLTLRERDLLMRDSIEVDESVLRKLRVAEVIGHKVRFVLTPNEFNHLLDAIAPKANHTDSLTALLDTQPNPSAACHQTMCRRFVSGAGGNRNR